MSPEDAAEAFSGALTLLRECVNGQAGERLLIVHEPEDKGYYDADAPKLTAAAARSMGMKVYSTETAAFPGSAEDRSSLYDTLRGFDHVVFFSRVGDQIRFAENAGMPSATICYALNLELLSSEFGTACYHGMCEIKDAIDNAFMQASKVRVSCPHGTDYTGRADCAVMQSSEVSLKRFPMLISRPVPARGFSGRVALSRFLVDNGHSIDEPQCLSLPSDVFACIEHNRIVRFEGNTEDVERISAHYRNVSASLDIEPWFVDSWHAGIHPACYFSNQAENDIQRWCGSAFGNPRLLHFHTCGEYAPGEINWFVFDPTIYLDDTPLWEAGRLYPERLPGGAELMARHPQLARLYQNPYREIGLTG